MARITISRISFALAQRARARARLATTSASIRKSMQLKVLDFGYMAIEVPYYWAIYYHDGRGPVRARPRHKLVFFLDPSDDPRINGAARNYPVRATQIRRLSKSQFRRFLAQGKMVVEDRVGPAAGDPFFTEGLAGFKNATGYGKTVLPHMSAYVKKTLGPLLDIRIGARLPV